MKHSANQAGHKANLSLCVADLDVILHLQMADLKLSCCTYPNVKFYVLFNLVWPASTYLYLYANFVSDYVIVFVAAVCCVAAAGFPLMHVVLCCQNSNTPLNVNSLRVSNLGPPSSNQFILYAVIKMLPLDCVIKYI